MRIRQHVNPLKSNFFTIAPAAVAVPPGVPLEVELGSAEAWFLMDRARLEPGSAYVGVEIRREMVAKANGDCRAAGLPQVQSVFANMSVDLPRLFAGGRVYRFFLNFPDPFFKRQQHKRRAVNEDLFAQLHPLLQPGGEIYVNTDIFDLALESMAALEEDSAETPRRYVNLLAPWSFLPANPFSARSRRERQCETEGTKVWRLGYRRV
jgi:tRNA (guanine-N7-)-methyltransferase